MTVSWRVQTAVARMVLRARPPVDSAAAEQMLLAALGASWPSGATASFLLLPGGFLLSNLPLWSGGRGWSSEPADSDVLVKRGGEVIHRVISKRVLKSAIGKVDAIAVGVDLRDAESGACAELAALFDLKTGDISWTGKSLLRSDQRDIVRVTDLASHFVKIGAHRVLLLGCHDLNFFSPRGRARQAPEGRVASLRREMDARVFEFKPTIVLQLPHGTDTPSTWRTSWLSLNAAAPSIRAWASGISYYRSGPGRCRAPLLDVCRLTKGGDASLDLILD